MAAQCAAESHVACPGCGRLLYGLREPLPGPQELIRADHVVPVEGVPAPREGERIACPFCGAYLEPAFQEAWARARWEAALHPGR